MWPNTTKSPENPSWNSSWNDLLGWGFSRRAFVYLKWVVIPPKIAKRPAVAGLDESRMEAAGCAVGDRPSSAEVVQAFLLLKWVEIPRKIAKKPAVAGEMRHQRAFRGCS